MERRGQPRGVRGRLEVVACRVDEPDRTDGRLDKLDAVGVLRKDPGASRV
jgi:hypothetical protein